MTTPLSAEQVRAEIEKLPVLARVVIDEHAAWDDRVAVVSRDAVLALLSRLSVSAPERETDAERWRWLRTNAHIGISEDGTLFIGAQLSDEMPSLFAETPEEVDLDEWCATAPWLNAQQRATIIGLAGGDPLGVVTDSATLDAAVDHQRATPPSGTERET